SAGVITVWIFIRSLPSRQHSIEDIQSRFAIGLPSHLQNPKWHYTGDKQPLEYHQFYGCGLASTQASISGLQNHNKRIYVPALQKLLTSLQTLFHNGTCTAAVYWLPAFSGCPPVLHFHNDI